MGNQIVNTVKEESHKVGLLVRRNSTDMRNKMTEMKAAKKSRVIINKLNLEVEFVDYSRSDFQFICPANQIKRAGHSNDQFSRNADQQSPCENPYCMLTLFGDCPILDQNLAVSVCWSCYFAY